MPAACMQSSSPGKEPHTDPVKQRTADISPHLLPSLSGYLPLRKKIPNYCRIQSFHSIASSTSGDDHHPQSGTASYRSLRIPSRCAGCHGLLRVGHACPPHPSLAKDPKRCRVSRSLLAVTGTLF
jgi:hypothetical protein